MSAFLPKFDQLPKRLPIFPLDNVILLPGSDLPLRIFETRYLEMVDEALRGPRLIGMVQPEGKQTPSIGGSDEVEPKLFNLGTAGKITSFSETDEGTYNIVLTGIVRFSIYSELNNGLSFRCVKPDYSAFETDLNWSFDTIDDSRISDDMFNVIETYFVKEKIDVDMPSLKQAPPMQLVNTLAISCPFTALEKQALLEAKDLPKRTSILLSLMEMANLNSPEPSSLN